MTGATNDTILKLQEIALKHFYLLIWCDNLSDFDFYSFVLLENLDNIIRKKEKLVKSHESYERWLKRKNERF